MFDLSGHEFYETVALGMAKNPDLLMVVYDCTNADSLKNGLKWLDKVKKLNNKSSIPGVLVGAKSEYKSAKEVSSEDGKKYADKIGLDFFEVSAVIYSLYPGVQHQHLASLSKSSQQGPQNGLNIDLICMPSTFLTLSSILHFSCLLVGENNLRRILL